MTNMRYGRNGNSAKFIFNFHFLKANENFTKFNLNFSFPKRKMTICSRLFTIEMKIPRNIF